MLCSGEPVGLEGCVVQRAFVCKSMSTPRSRRRMALESAEDSYLEGCFLEAALSDLK